MVLAAEDERDVGLLTPEGDAPLGTQILGAKGAPRLTFAEFQRFKIRVTDEGRVAFLGTDERRAVPLKVGDRFVTVDKGFPPGTRVR